MKVSLIFAIYLISFVICDELKTDKQPTEIRISKDDNNGKDNRMLWKRETDNKICKEAKSASVQSVYVAEGFIQLFIANFDGSKGWTAGSSGLIKHEDINPKYIAQSSQPDKLGKFTLPDGIPNSQELENNGTFKRVSASFLHFSDSFDQKAYLVMGLNAHEFDTFTYWPTGKVKPITDFFKEGEKKLLMPEDKLEEVVSVALIKWFEKDEIKDHAIYKIILKTVTKKLVKAYFKITSKGEIMSSNSEPFVPSAEVMNDEDEFDLLEESALYNVGEKDQLSMGYRFIGTLAFPTYFDYNAEENTYKEYPMRTKKSFNEFPEKLGDKIPYWNRFIVPTETWLGCPEQTFCLGHSFDAVFFAGNQYYAILEDSVYTLALSTSRPGIGERLTSRFPKYIWLDEYVDAAFTFGGMIFFIREGLVYYMANSSDENAESLPVDYVFPDRDELSFQMSAVITLDKAEDAAEVLEEIPKPSHLKSARQTKYERAAETTEDEISKKMVYVYSSTKDEGKVYQYEMVNKTTPKFKLVASKKYNEVNAALPLDISLVFTAEDKVVTTVHHFMVEQSSLTFFKKAENLTKFTLVDKYFGCNSENLERKLTKQFVVKYVEFAGPKPGTKVFAKPNGWTLSLKSTEPVGLNSKGTDTDSNEKPKRESTKVTLRSPSGNDEEKNEVKSSGTLAQISTASFIIQAVVNIILCLISL